MINNLGVFVFVMSGVPKKVAREKSEDARYFFEFRSEINTSVVGCKRDALASRWGSESRS